MAGRSERDRLNDVHQSERVLGRGAYGAVYLGKWHCCKVAIKRMHDVLIFDERGQFSELYRRFDLEFQVHSTIRHPHVAQMLGVCPPLSRRGSPGLVLEYLPVTLRQRYAGEPLLSRADEVKIACDVALGLAHLHSLRVLHRDLTTNNVMLTSSVSPCHAKLTDIGAATLMAAGAALQEMSINPGNQVYMAPETHRASGASGKAQYGYEADCYSFGVTVMSMVLRREPPDPFELGRHGRGRDIAAIPSEHPLRRCIAECVDDAPLRRPKPAEICRRLDRLLNELEAASASAHGQPGAMSARESLWQPEDVSEMHISISLLADPQLALRCVALLRPRIPRPIQSMPKWHVMTSIPDDVEGFGGPALHQGYMYVACYHKERNEECSLRRIDMQHLSDGEWEPIPVPTDGEWDSSGFFTHNDDLYLLLGTEEGDNEVWDVRKLVDGEWLAITRLPCIPSCAFKVVNSRLLYVGEENDNCCVHSYNLACEADPVEWERWPDLPGHAGVASILGLEERVHVVGIARGNDQVRRCVQSIDASVDTGDRQWSGTALPQLPHGWAGACGFHGTIVIAGGAEFQPGSNSASERKDSVHMLNTDSNTWLPLPSLNEARWMPDMLYEQGKIICLGGLKMGYSVCRTIEVLHL